MKLATTTEDVETVVRTAIEKARGREALDRSLKAEGLKILERPAGGARYGRWRVSSSCGKRAYEVIWASETAMSCSCADAWTSELALCKHRWMVRWELAPKAAAVVDGRRKPSGAAGERTRGGPQEDSREVRGRLVADSRGLQQRAFDLLRARRREIEAEEAEWEEIEDDDDSEARALAWGELVRRETRGSLVRSNSTLHVSARDFARDHSVRDHSVRDHSVRDHSVRDRSPAPSARNAEVVELPLDRPVAMIRPRCTAGRVVAPITDVHVYVPAGRSLGIARLLDREGHVRANVSPQTLQDALRRTRGLWMAEGLAEQLQAWVEHDAWRARFGRFERKLRRHLAGDGPPPTAWVEVESALKVRLRPYQIDGVLFAARERRALLADDMGLGKTVQTIATIVLLRALGEAHRTVVVCPASLKDQWRREIHRYAPSLSVCVLEGSRGRRREAIRTTRADVWVLNFTTMRHDLGELRALDAALLVVDEAQRIKNWNTLTAKAVKALTTPRVLALTGTPLENRLQELHSVMELLDPRALGPMWRLFPEHAVVDEEEKKVKGVRRLDLLRQRMGRRWLRRTKEQVLAELPERLDEVQHASITDRQRTAHAEHHQRAQRILRKEVLLQDDVLRLMRELQEMRMICDGLALYLFEEVEPRLESWSVEKLLAAYPSPKLEVARDHLLSLVDAGEKVVVFSQWRRMLVLLERVLRPELRARGLRCLELHGDLDGARRARAVAAFHDDPDARLFLSTDAGGVGLNLQGAARTVMQLDLPWNPAVFEQRVGRVHRMGQQGSVRVITLVTREGIEGRIAESLVHKRTLFEGVFDGTTDELRFGTDESFLKRMRRVFGVEEKPEAPTKAVVHRDEPPDAEMRRAPDEVPMTLDEEVLEVAVGGVVVRASRSGSDVKVDLGGVGEDAWAHLGRFLRSLGEGGALPPLTGS